jgi:hypothetical protein
MKFDNASELVRRGWHAMILRQTNQFDQRLYSGIDTAADASECAK